MPPALFPSVEAPPPACTVVVGSCSAARIEKSAYGTGAGAWHPLSRGTSEGVMEVPTQPPTPSPAPALDYVWCGRSCTRTADVAPGQQTDVILQVPRPCLFTHALCCWASELKIVLMACVSSLPCII